MNNSDAKKIGTHKCIGPGGMDCICCGPAPGKERKQFLRSAKRRFKAFVKKDIRNQLKEEE